MSTQHDIFNLAAGMCGEPALQNVDESSETGRQLRAFWPGTVAYCMEQYAWDFLETRVKLSRSATAPVWGYTYSYQLPGDCARLLVVSDTGLERGDFTAWRQAQGMIEADAEEVWIRYVSDTRKEQPGSWSETFVQWLSAELALRIAPKINPKALETIDKVAKRLRKEARSNDAAGGARQHVPAQSWSRAARGHRRSSEHGR